MGVPGGMPGTADALVAGVAALPPQVTSWSATGIGRSTLAVAMTALAKGGHLRVGMEDVLTISRGRPGREQHPARGASRRARRARPAPADDAGGGPYAARPSGGLSYSQTRT